MDEELFEETEGRSSRVLVELRASSLEEVAGIVETLGEADELMIDASFAPVPIRRPQSEREKVGALVTYVVRGLVADGRRETLASRESVFRVWDDTTIEPFGKCNGGRKGTLKRAALCVGAKQVGENGFTGEGVTIGIVDWGLDKSTLTNTVDGYRPTWGTLTTSIDHGNMCGVDATGMAPGANLYDLNLASPSGSGSFSALISEALAIFDWSLNRYWVDGTPHILSNSWGLYDLADDTAGYSTDPSHPFTLKVAELVAEGVVVLFAAGNCGDTCPDHRCNGAQGPGQSIWGANGLDEVMTIGAVKLSHKRLKYSSQGPAALAADKPDFCGYSSFAGYYPKDSGTSAACPVVAGCVALLMEADSSLGPAQLKSLLADSAQDLETPGFDHNTGAGVVRVDEALYELKPELRPQRNWREKLCDRKEETILRCNAWRQTVIATCTNWADQGQLECEEWKDEGQSKCEEWKDEGQSQCGGWFRWFCLAWYWVANWVCQGWYWVATWVCQGWYWVANWVCTAYAFVGSFVCKAWVRFLVAVTFTNCKCR